MLWCGNIVLLTVRFLDVVKFATFNSFIVTNLCTASLSLNFLPPDSSQYHNLLPWTIRHQVHLNAVSYQNMVNLIVFPSGDVQVNLWMLCCGNIVLLTSECCASTTVIFTPKMIIFKWQRNNSSLQVDASPGSLDEVSESGYVNLELSVKLLNHVINHVKPRTKCCLS
jgi:hypothetical protein